MKLKVGLNILTTVVVALSFLIKIPLQVEDTLDLGELESPFQCRKGFVISNRSWRPVKVESVSTACSCVRVENETMVIGPFSSKEVIIDFDGSRLNDPYVSSTILVKSQAQMFTVKWTADLSKQVFVGSNQIVLFPDSSFEFSLNLFAKEFRDVQIDANSDFVKISRVEKARQDQYKVLLRFEKALLPRQFDQEFELIIVSGNGKKTSKSIALIGSL